MEIDRTNFECEIPIKKLKTQKLFKTPMDSKQNTFLKREYHEMNDYYIPQSYSRPSPQPSQPKKDHFDLFFEAISASVKNLPPKLAAEVKSRVSQVIAEFELRAICEREAQQKVQQQQSVVTIPTQVTSVVTIDPVITTETNNVENTTSSQNQQSTDCSSTVTQYVYAYQQKKEIN